MFPNTTHSTVPIAMTPIPPILSMINIIIWPNVEYVSTMLTGDSPVTLMPDTTNNVSIGLTSTPCLCTNGRFNNKKRQLWLSNNIKLSPVEG